MTCSIVQEYIRHRVKCLAHFTGHRVPHSNFQVKEGNPASLYLHHVNQTGLARTSYDHPIYLPEEITSTLELLTRLHFVQIRETSHDGLGVGVVGLYVQCHVRRRRGWVVHDGSLGMEGHRLPVAQWHVPVPHGLLAAGFVMTLSR